MVWINTNWIITFMTNNFILWDFPILKNKRKTMSSVIYNFSTSSKCKVSISSARNTSTPQPTSISFFNPFPKVFYILFSDFNHIKTKKGLRSGTKASVLRQEHPPGQLPKLKFSLRKSNLCPH